MQNITLGGTAVRQLDGLYSLNDLHAAAGGDRKHQPANFMRLDTTVALAAEIQSSDVRTAHKSINGGPNRGTYVCRELVYAYAMWISPKFNLQVIRAFDALQKVGAGAPAHPPALQKRIPGPRKGRLNLSFVRADPEEGFQHWFVPSREGNWHEHYGIGEAWFAEVLELARRDPQEAYLALRAIGPRLLPFWNHGHEQSFFEQMARWALTGIACVQTDTPPLSFAPLNSGMEPLEGLDFYRGRARVHPSVTPAQRGAMSYALGKQIPSAYALESNYGAFPLDEELRCAILFAIQPILEWRMR